MVSSSVSYFFSELKDEKSNCVKINKNDERLLLMRLHLPIEK